MKLFLSTLFVAAMAASLQAVTVAWTLANSRWIYEGNDQGKVTNWTCLNDSAKPNLNVYVFFSTQDLSAAGAAATVPGGYDSVNNEGTVKLASYSASSSVDFATSGTSALSVTAELTGSTSPGYYYLVVFSGNNFNSNATDYSYAVARTTKITGVDNNQGVYNMEVGTVPNVMDYVELNWMAGSTWGAPLQTPEPTALALLALGVAGLALRRKNA